MSASNGDKARFGRQLKRKLKRRERARELKKEIEAKAAK
jgi:hypothetical protein